MEKQKLIEKGYIPLDKSWHIRMGVLDLLAGKDDSITFLEKAMKEGMISDDLEALYIASVAWKYGHKCIYVGESGTLYRLLQFADWVQGGERLFGTKGTLTKRRKEMCNDPDIVNWSLEELLELDGGTTQWASASVICPAIFDDYDAERIKTGKPKLNLSYEAVDHWLDCREEGKRWDVRHDDTIAEQAAAYLGLLKTGRIEFEAKQPEDYCFARAFDVIRQGEIGHYRKVWGSLEKHESNRLEEIETALVQYRNGEIVESMDHRVVQAIAMLAKYERKGVNFNHKRCVSKSWPEFWKFLDDLASNDSARLAE